MKKIIQNEAKIMVIFQIDHYVKPEFIEAYKTAVHEDARNSLLEEGVIRFEVFQEQANLTHFTLLEVYRDLQARESHFQTPHLLKFRKVLKKQEMLVQSESKEIGLLFPFEIKK
jgi:(4S)-4-hydroxy-5-phosphonooxypentane-2,3-dione isomerase